MWLVKMLSRQGCEAERKLENFKSKKVGEREGCKLAGGGGWEEQAAPFSNSYY